VILKSLQLSNFRGFYGKTPKIIFSRDEDKSVTLIHAMNGAGKTTLLNALTWVLYGETTFSSPELINRNAIKNSSKGEEASCWVELVFKNIELGEDIEYFIRREVTLVVRGDRNSNGHLPQRLILQQRLRTGESKSIDSDVAQDYINKIIPSELSRYFFFEGENPARLGNLNREEKSTIANATKRLLGVEPLDRSVGHLTKAIGMLEKELAKVGTQELKNLVEQKSKTEKKIIKIENDIKIIKEQQVITKDNIKKLRQVHQSSIDSQKLEEKRRIIEESEKTIKKDQSKLKSDMKTRFSKYSHKVLLSNLSGQVRGVIAGLRETGELPKGIKKQFITDLLNSQKCICGTELKNGQSSHECVLQWLEKAGIQDAEEKIIQLGAVMEGIDKESEEFFEFINDIQERINLNNDKLNEYEEQLLEIRDILKDSNNEGVAGVERNIEDEESRYEDMIKRIDRKEMEVNNDTDYLDKMSKEIISLSRKLKTNKTVALRVEVAQEVKKKIIQFRKKLALDFRSSLEKSVQRIFDEITITPYHVILKEDFSIDLFTEVDGGDIVDPSRGESQVLSLAFIGGIISETKKFYTRAENSHMGEYIQYPVVMDAPFGQLDSPHRRYVTKRLAQIADQIIILVTPTQFRGEVENSIKNITGKQYLLRYNTTSKDLERKLEVDYKININENSYSLALESETGYEYSEIVEI